MSFEDLSHVHHQCNSNILLSHSDVHGEERDSHISLYVSLSFTRIVCAPATHTFKVFASDYCCKATTCLWTMNIWMWQWRHCKTWRTIVLANKLVGTSSSFYAFLQSNFQATPKETNLLHPNPLGPNYYSARIPSTREQFNYK